jgi:hypothetical protein
VPLGRRLALASAVVAVLTASPATAATTPALHGVVERASDGSPVPGARVLALWRDSLERAVVVETTTAVDGSFDLPTISAPALSAVSAERSVLYALARGEGVGTTVAPSVGHAVVKLTALPAAPEARATKLSELVFWLAFLMRRSDAATPAFLGAVDTEWAALPASVRTNQPSLRPMFEWFSAEYRSAARGDTVTSSLPLPGMPPAAYSAPAFRMTVVDARTRRPLEGVIVVAQWMLYAWGKDTRHELMSVTRGHPERPVQDVYWAGKIITLEAFSSTPQDRQGTLALLPRVLRAERPTASPDTGPFAGLRRPSADMLDERYPPR